jgi:hypothetical protein
VDAEAEQPRGRVKGVAEVAAVRAAFLPPSPSACVEDRFITGRLANKSFVPALNPTARFGVEAHTAASIRRAQPQLSPTASWRLGPMATHLRARASTPLVASRLIYAASGKPHVRLRKGQPRDTFTIQQVRSNAVHPTNFTL